MCQRIKRHNGCFKFFKESLTENMNFTPIKPHNSKEQTQNKLTIYAPKSNSENFLATYSNNLIILEFLSLLATCSMGALMVVYFLKFFKTAVVSGYCCWVLLLLFSMWVLYMDQSWGHCCCSDPIVYGFG